MRVARNGLGEFPGREEILAQEQDANVPMMRVLEKEIQHAFVVGAFVHEIVQHQESPLRGTEPLVQLLRRGQSFVKPHLFLLHLVKGRLPGSVTIMFHPRRGVHQFVGVT